MSEFRNRREAGNAVVDDARVLGDGVADVQAALSGDAQNVARPRLLLRFAVAAERPVRERNADRPAGLGVRRSKVLFELSAANPQKRQPVEAQGEWSRE